jgi:hypothetical protein
MLKFCSFLIILTAMMIVGLSPTANVAADTATDTTIVDVHKVQWGPLKVAGLPAGAEIYVMRGDLAKGAAEILLRFPAGYNVPIHNHTSDETYVWLEGKFALVRADGTRVEFEGPAFVSFPGNASPHALECEAKTPCIVYVRYSRPFDINYFPAGRARE